jgi:hypothetical protein
VCGARAGERPAELDALMAGAREGWPEGAAQTPATDPRTPPPANGPHLPPKRVSALLLAAFLGFGILLGSAAGHPVQSSLAAGRPGLKVVVPPSGSAPPASAPSATTSSEPPAAEEQPTPAAAPSAATASTSHASSKAGTSAGEGEGSGEAEGASGGGGGSGSSGSSGSATKLPPIKHVFVIALSDQPYATVFGPASTAHYLSQTLEHQGELLVRYDAVAHEELANGIALVSGQGPTAATAANCPTYTDLAPATGGADEQVLGNGCVYPASTRTLPGELAARHLSWRAYVQGIDEPGTTAAACAHPQPGQADPTSERGASTGPYATFRNPLVYFHAIVDSPACTSTDVGMSRLAGDLAKGQAAPSLAYLVPDRCHDGNPTPCTPGAPAGMGPADSFLSRTVPEIERSSAYHHGGLIVITVDEAPSSGEYGDSSSCCGQPTSYPNLAGVPAAPFSGHGGGTVGALLISPYVKGGTTSQEQFDHYSLLRTIEDLFSVHHLGYSALPAVRSLQPSLFLAKPSG